MNDLADFVKVIAQRYSPELWDTLTFEALVAAPQLSPSQKEGLAWSSVQLIPGDPLTVIPVPGLSLLSGSVLNELRDSSALLRARLSDIEAGLYLFTRALYHYGNGDIANLEGTPIKGQEEAYRHYEYLREIIRTSASGRGPIGEDAGFNLSLLLQDFPL